MGRFANRPYANQSNAMSPFDPKIHHRRSIRLPGYDYSQAGAYFVTIVTQNRENLFGEVVNGEMKLSPFGQIAADTWQWLETQYPYVELGAWVVMLPISYFFYKEKLNWQSILGTLVAIGGVALLFLR